MDQYKSNATAAVGAGQPANTARDTNASQEILSRLTNIRERLSALVDREHRVVCRAFGEPPTESGGQVRPEPAGMLALIGSRLDDLDTLLSVGSDHLSRIDGII